MNMYVTFSCTDLSLHPEFDTLVTIDTGDTRVQDLLEGKITGEYINDQITELRLGAFAQCTNLSYVALPNCKQFVSSNVFYGCNKITALDLSSLEVIADGASTFNGMTSLKTTSLPELTGITTTSRLFQNCNKLETIYLPKLTNTSLAAYAFSNCNKLHTLVLGGSVLNPLANTQAFTNAGNQTETGLRIYVPDALVDAYKMATNWSSFANKIKPMSELEAL